MVAVMQYIWHDEGLCALCSGGETPELHAFVSWPAILTRPAAVLRKSGRGGERVDNRSCPKRSTLTDHGPPDNEPIPAPTASVGSLLFVKAHCSVRDIPQKHERRTRATSPLASSPYCWA
jgi:hypothetical protein